MEKTSLDKKAIAHNRGDTGYEEDDCSTISELKFDLKIERISHNLPWILDVKQPNNNLRCSEKSCPCGKELALPNYTGLVSPNKNLARHCTDSAERQAPNSLILCRATPFVDVPMNQRSSDFMFKSFKHQRGTQSINNLGDYIAECSPAAGTGSIIISPSGQLIFDLIEATFKARGLLKDPLVFQSNTPDVILSEVRLKSVNTRQIKFSELTSSPSRLCLRSPQRPKGIVSPFRKQRSHASISDRMLLSCSSSNSSFSYPSASPGHNSFSTGLLQCVWQSGIRYFVFSVDDDQNEVYVANPLKIESCRDKALDYMYLFHSRTDSGKGSKNRINSTLEFVGKMKVSSSLILHSDRSNFMETEFVLFGANEKHSREKQSLSPTLTKGKGLSKKVSEMFRPSHSSKNKAANIVEQNTQFKDLREVFVGDLSKIDELGPVNNLADDFPTNLQLVAIVVKDYQHDMGTKAAASGWGLKFLKKAEESHVDTSPEPSVSSQSHQESRTSHRKECSRTFDVLVPAGLHGGPITRSGGPSSLTERWRSGGHCDCGGWDIGCPLTIINNHPICPEDFRHGESQQNCNSINLFVEGSKHGEPKLKLEKVNEDLHLIYFQSTLSALQSFSIAVALIHTQTPDLCLKL